jgi:hypothetical protein
MKDFTQRAGVSRVDEVVVYRWNTEIVPDDGLLSDAGWGAAG